MDIILFSFKWQSALLYLDNIVIVSTSPEGHIDHVEQALTLLTEAGVTLKLKKFYFFINCRIAVETSSNLDPWKSVHIRLT